MMPIVKDALRYRDRARTAKTFETRRRNKIKLQNALKVMTAAAFREFMIAVEPSPAATGKTNGD